jgi:hypothetical protein
MGGEAFQDKALEERRVKKSVSRKAVQRFHRNDSIDTLPLKRLF